MVQLITIDLRRLRAFHSLSGILHLVSLQYAVGLASCSTFKQWQWIKLFFLQKRWIKNKKKDKINPDGQTIVFHITFLWWQLKDWNNKIKINIIIVLSLSQTRLLRLVPVLTPALWLRSFWFLMPALTLLPWQTVQREEAVSVKVSVRDVS